MKKFIAPIVLAAAMIGGTAQTASAAPDPVKYADCPGQAQAVTCWTDNNPADTTAHPLTVIVYPYRADNTYIAPPRAGTLYYDIQRATGTVEQHTAWVDTNSLLTLAYGDTVSIEAGQAAYVLHVQNTLYR